MVGDETNTGYVNVLFMCITRQQPCMREQKCASVSITPIETALVGTKRGVCAQFLLDCQTSNYTYLALRLFRLDISVLESSQDTGGDFVQIFWNV